MSFQSFQKSLFLFILVAATAVFIWLINPYIMAIFWATVLALLFYPLRNWYVSLMQGKVVPGVLLTMLTMFALVFVPMYLLSLSILSEFTELYATVKTNQVALVNSVSLLDNYLPIYDTLGTFGITNEDIKLKLASTIGSVGGYIASSIAQFGQQTLKFAIQFFITLYALFFFLKDGENILEKLQKLLPLGDRRERRLYDRFASTVRATMKGTLIIGILQGIIGAILFWLVGIPAAALWGVIMAVLSIIPAIGSFVIWGPAGVVLILSGQIWEGVTVLLIGALVISSIDNILRPPLIGKDTQMPDMLILLSTLGGISAFGISGFVIGPVIAAFFLSLWNMFGEDYAKDLSLFG